MFPKIILWPDKDSQETTLYFVIFPLQESIMAEIDFLKNEIIGLLRHIKQWTKDQWVIFQLFYFTGLLVKLKIFIWSWSYCVHGFGVCQLSLFHYQMLSYDLPSSNCVLVHSIIWWLDKKFETKSAHWSLVLVLDIVTAIIARLQSAKAKRIGLETPQSLSRSPILASVVIVISLNLPF